jgi:hypothetical protein
MYREAYGRNLRPAIPHDQLLMHNLIYWLQENGIMFESYAFFLHFNGLYAHTLQTVLLKTAENTEVEEYAEVELTEKAKRLLQMFRDYIAKQNTTYEEYEFIEALTTIHYYRKYKYATSTKEEVLEKFGKKTPHLSNLENNSKIWDLLIESEML